MFKLKTKNGEDSSSSSSKGDVSPSPGLRMHKSVKNFSDGKSSEDEVSKLRVEKTNSASNDRTKSPHLPRSSSATCFEKEDNQRSSSTKGSSDKTSNAKVSNINGNIIHLTVNNYLAPVNNINSVGQPSSNTGKDQKPPKPSITPQSQSQMTKSLPPKYNLPTDMKKEEPNKLIYSESSFSNVVGSSQLSDKSKH